MIQLHLYGFLIGLGILVGVKTAERAWRFLAAKYQVYRQFSVWAGAWWGILPALIGARLYHVIDFWEYYAQFPQKIPATWEGGMGIWGGVLGGAVGLLIYAIIISRGAWSRKIKNKRSKIKKLFLAMADVAAVGLPLGQTIGRLGNFFNQELYGLPTQLPWGLYIKPENRVTGFEQFDSFHPLFTYEGLWNIGIFLVLLRLIRRRKVKQPGRLFFTYLGLYGLGRFFLEFLRINPWQLGVLTTAQWLGLIGVGLSLAFYSTVRKQ